MTSDQRSIADANRVYVSSTALDLRSFRQAVIAAIRKLGDEHWIVVCQEDYPSEDKLPLEKCLSDVARCDVYVGMFGFRYGFVPPGYDRAITELEYREAMAGKKTVLVFLADDECEIPPKFVDKGRAAEQIGALRTELQAVHLIDQFFKTPDEVAKQVVTALSKIARKKAESAGPAPPLRWKAPLHHKKRFFDIHGILDKLHEEPKAAQIVSLYGLPGVGKTHTATAYINEYRDHFTACFWVNAEARATSVADMETIARGLHLRVQAEAEHTVSALKAWFDHPDNQGWLLVLDNANEIQLVHWLLPTARRGRVLLTTNELAVRKIADLQIEIKPLNPDEGADALLALADWEQRADAVERQAAYSISSELGGLMLAIDQAAAYIVGGSTPGRYLSLYKKRRAALLRQRGDGGLHESVFLTFQLAFEQVFKRNPASAELLRLCAVLAPEAVPEELISGGAEFLGDSLGPAAADDHERHNTIVAANRLLKYDPASRTLSIHRLTHAVLRDEMDAALRATWTRRAVLALDRVFPAVEFPHWTELDRLVPHSIECGRGAVSTGVASVEVTRLLHASAVYLLHRGNYRESGPLLKECLLLQEAMLGRDHPDTLKSRCDIARWTSMKGDYALALPLIRELLPEMERVFGPDHRETLKARSIAAGCVEDVEGTADALRLLREVLMDQARSLGPEHPDTLMNRNNLASWIGATGDLKEALRLFRELLPDVERVQGQDHPDTLTVLRNIALWTARMGESAEALRLFRALLPTVERLMGDDHPETLRAKLNIAYNEGKLGKPDLALRLTLKLMPDVERLLGDHPDAFTIRSYVALWTRETGDLDQALRLFRELVPQCERVLGRDHTATLMSLRELAVSVIESGLTAEGCGLLLEGASRAANRYGAESVLNRKFHELISTYHCCDS